MEEIKDKKKKEIKKEKKENCIKNKVKIRKVWWKMNMDLILMENKGCKLIKVKNV